MKEHRISCRFIPHKPHEGTLSSLITSNAQITGRQSPEELPCARPYRVLPLPGLRHPTVSVIPSRNGNADVGCVQVVQCLLEVGPVRPTASPGVKFRSMLLASDAESARVVTCPYFKICSLRHSDAR